MSPVIVFAMTNLLNNGLGGSTIITSVLQEILNVIDFQMSLEESSKKPNTFSTPARCTVS